MARRPDFTAAQRKRLKDLQVIPEQVEQLRLVLPFVYSVLDNPATVNDVKATLREIAKRTHALHLVLGAAVSRRDAARAVATALVDGAFMEIRHSVGLPLRFDEGSELMRHLIPQLEQLHAVSNDLFNAIERAKLPPTRHRLSDPHPVGAIAGALSLGWADAHPQWTSPSDPGGPMSEQFRPSAKDGSAFLEIVDICYEAAGAPFGANTLKATRALMSYEKKKLTARRILESRWSSPTSSTPVRRPTRKPRKAISTRGKNRTPTKT